MIEPKRHHWWPQLQSQHWTNDDGLIHVTRRDGTHFTTSPKNIGVESELYTRFGETGQKDREIEKWFSREIETPFASAFDDIISLRDIKKEPFNPGPTKAATVRELGYQITPYREYISIPEKLKGAVANYAAALLVRNPNYLSKLKAFHSEKNSPQHEFDIENMALHNMLLLFEQYRKVIEKASCMLILADGDHEFLFPDAGITAQEPWRTGPAPFDIHFPLTPKLALEILPVPNGPYADRAFIMRAKNNGIARQNKISLGNANRFVFSKNPPPAKFIAKYFGVPAPKAYGYRFVNGQIETTYDRSRDN